MTTRTLTRRLAAVGALILLGFSIRALSLDAQSLWRDEVDALRFATAPPQDMLSNFTRPGWNGPLYYLLLRGWIAAAGTTEYALRFFSLLPGVISIPLTYVLGRRLFNAHVGIVSALLVTTSPYLCWYSQEVKMYALVLGLALLAMYSLRRALQEGRWHWWLIQVATTSLAFYTHIFAALLVPVQVFSVLADWPRARRRWRGALVSLGFLTLPYLPLAVWQAPLALQARDTGFTPYSLDQMCVILMNRWSTGIEGWGKPFASALTVILAAMAVVMSGTLLPRWTDSRESAGHSARVRDRLALLIWLSVPVGCLWLLSLRQPLFTDRYLIWSAPAFYILVALTLTSFVTARHAARWAVVPLMGAILVTNGVNLWGQATRPIKSEFRAAAAYVRGPDPASADRVATSEQQRQHRVYLPATTGGSPGFEDLIIFQIPHGKHVFDYYFPVETYPHADGLYTNHRTADGGYLMSEEDAARQLRAVTRGHETIWLVMTEAAMWDERNLVQRWLDDYGQRVDQAHFSRVDVYRYDLAPR